MTTTATAPDLAAVKARQQQTWASGDFAVIASRIVLVSELLADNTDLRAGWRVLDVAAGNGNATLAAARSGTSAIGVDYVPELLADGRSRAVAEGLDVGMQLGDAAENVRSVERTCTFRFTAAEEFVAFFRRWYGPTLQAFAALNDAGQAALAADLAALAHDFDRHRDGASVAIPATYLETVFTVR